MGLPITNQKLIFPQEIEVWYLLPAIRKAFTLEMIKCGLSQKNIASILGVTEAAISQYKKDKRASEFKFDDEIKKEIKQSVKKVIAKQSSNFKEIMHLNNHIKKTSAFCKVHRSKSWTPDNCEAVCKVYLE